MFTGPNIVKDGLIFGYDTGYPIVSGNSDTYRFNLGEPTENLVGNPFTITSGYATSIGTRTDNVALNWTGQNTAGLISGSGYIAYTAGFGATNGNQYTTSWFLKGGTASTVYMTWGGAHGGNRTTFTVNFSTGVITGLSQASGEIYGVDYIDNGWWKIHYSSTLSTGNNYYPQISITGTAYFGGLQIEKKSHATPFTTGTRSATQSLIDLKESTNIDLSNVSFDSNAQMTFDGTDDEINTGITTQLTDFSCVVVFKNNNSAAWGRLVDKYYVNGFFISAYFASVGSGYVGAGIIEPNSPYGQALQYDTSKYNYFVVTRSGTTHTIYLNGSTNSASKTGSGAALSSNQMSIGAWYDTNNSQRYTGEIPVVKLYNRALSPKEIQQDFEAYKNRFNI